MINKSKILNAISEGIKTGFKFSVDNAVDDSSFIDFSDSKINNVESFNMGKLERDFVDLGLSVKWAKFNIGATCQNTPNSWYGNYYAWGELESKQVYNEKSYDLTLYEKYDENGFNILLPEDDIVTLTYYGINKFRMPIKKEIEELLDESKIKSEWKTNYQGIGGLNGREFTSKINGNSIFIPAAGYFNGSYFDNNLPYCYLWSNSFNSVYSNNAWCFYFDFGDIFIDKYFRYFGFSARGVCL